MDPGVRGRSVSQSVSGGPESQKEGEEGQESEEHGQEQSNTHPTGHLDLLHHRLPDPTSSTSHTLVLVPLSMSVSNYPLDGMKF